MTLLSAFLDVLRAATFSVEVHIREFKGNWALLVGLTVLVVAILILLFRALERWF